MLEAFPSNVHLYGQAVNVASELNYLYSSKSNLKRLSTQSKKTLRVSKEERISKRRNLAINKSKAAV